MAHRWFRPEIILGGVIFVLLTALCGAPRPACAGEAGRFWTELPGAGHFAKAQAMPNFVALAAKLSPAVVNVSLAEDGRSAGSSDPPFDPDNPHSFGDFGGPESERSLGSGFIISKDGYILTDAHVVDGPGKVTVTTRDGEIYAARIAGRDEKSDLALIKIDPRRDLPVAPLGNSGNVQVGQWVIAIGNPFGFDHSVTAGIVSAKGRFVEHNYDDFIQTDTSINPGNSGGPLIDLRGEVVGVNSAIYTHTGGSMGIGFAIPIDLAKEELPQLRALGRVERGWLGVFIQRLTPELAASLGLVSTHGALVAQVLKNSPAKAAGVKRGDVITAFNGEPVDDSRELPLLVGHAEIGGTAIVTILRDAKTIELPVTIRESRGEQLAAAEDAHRANLKTADSLGLKVKDLTPKLADEFGLALRSGVVISSVAPGSSADAAGLRARDVILEVDRAPVGNSAAYRMRIKRRTQGQYVLLWIERGENKLYVALKPEA
ncbi:MAG: DegQ family serine endoprotease [Candidatus Binataceae bacterium]